MISKQTVFIIGAGAGVDIKMPLGFGLAEEISRLTDIKLNRFGQLEAGSPSHFQEILRKMAQNETGNQWPNKANQLALACKKISEGINLSNSIDDFVNVHQADSEIVRCAKLAISYCIISAERSSLLHASQSKPEDLKFRNLRSIWYADLFKAISHGVTLDQIRSLFKNITFINFNYDRCLEHFLVNAIRKLYICDDSTANEIVRSVRIYHPYGQIGCIPAVPSPNLTPVRFGGDEHNTYESLAVSLNISTYTEKIQDIQMVNNIKLAIAVAEQLVFLGFGFHAQNMELLRPDGRAQVVPKNIYATAYGISKSNLRVIKTDLMPMSGNGGILEQVEPQLHIETEADCATLLRDYDRILRAM